jgi:catechol 2,3-dioxygenase
MTTVQEGGRASIDAETVITPTLHHVNLKTTRLDEMIEWYGVVCGMKPNFRNAFIAFLSNDDANHRLALGVVPGVEADPDKPKHDGMHHSAYEYDSLDGLLGTYLRLKREEILPHACLDHGLTMSFYYEDPDGNSVELQADNYGDWAKSGEFIRSDERFAENPIGVFVDPDALVEVRRSGVEPWEMHERAFRGEFAPSVPPDPRAPTPAPQD